MNCRNCNNESAWHVLTTIDDETKELTDCCDRCGLEGGGEAIPDVFLNRAGQRFQNLCDEMGTPYEITSRKQKKEIMDRLGVSEAGDRVNGAPFGTKTWIEGSRPYRKKQFDKDRPAIREAYRRYLENARRK